MASFRWLCPTSVTLSITFVRLLASGGVIDAARNPPKVHLAGRAPAYFLTVVSRDGRIAWDAKDKGEFKLVHSLEQAKQAIRDVNEREIYLDVHEWCFTPTSFRLMMRDLFDLGFIQLKELAFYPTTGKRVLHRSLAHRRTTSRHTTGIAPASRS
jgi:hypothetical protein